MNITGKIVLDIPGHPFVNFGPDNTVKDIFDCISKNIAHPADAVFINVDVELDDIDVSEKKEKEVAESVVETGKKSIDLVYYVPKNLAFTQRFQDRINHDIPNIIESVYDDCSVVDILWFDEEGSMKLTIKIEFASENYMKYSKYLDENVGYAVKDIVKYYSE